MNELLCFVQNNFVKISKEELSTAICSFYATDEVVRAKNCLFSLASSANVNDLPRNVTRKAGENKRRMDTDDTLQLFALLDVNKAPLPTFAATNLSRLPAPVNSTGSEISFLKHDVHDLHDKLAYVQSKLDSLCSVVVPSTVQSSTLAGMASSEGQEFLLSSGPNSATIAPMTSTSIGQGEIITTSVCAVEPTTAPVMKAPINYSGCGVDPGASVQADWAQVAATLNNEIPFQTVTYKRQRQPVLVGSRLIDCGVKAVPRRLTCFVGRLDNLTTVEDLTVYLSNAGIKDVKCTKLIPKDGRKFYSAAFRVSCDSSSKNLFYDETLWPAGVELRDWVFHNRNGES